MVLFPLFVLFLLQSLQARIEPQPNNRWNRDYGNPGIKLRLSRKGAEHVKNVAVKLLNEQLANLRGFRAQHAISEGGIRGNIFLSDVQTLAYRPPSFSNLQFVPPNSIIFGIQDAAITLSGRFLGEAGPLLQIPGTVFGQLQGLSIQMMTQFRASADGLISVAVTNCQTQLRHSQFTLNPEGLLGPILKIFEVTINDLIRQRIPNLLCRSMRDIVERNSPLLFQKLTYIPLKEHFGMLSNGSGVIEKFTQRFTDGLFIDGRMVADPIVTNDFFETQQRGELRYADSPSPIPFYPRPIPTDKDSDRMLYLYASDYTLNSMLYHAYQMERLTIRVNEASLPQMYRGFVRTTCPDIEQVNGDFLQSICVGKLIPAMAKHFPNSTTKFVMLPHELPEMHFHNGRSTMDLNARILTLVSDNATRRDRQILVSSAEGMADIRLNAVDRKIAGDLKLRKLNIRLHRSAIPIEPEVISQMAPLAKTFLGPELARGLKEGLPYPLKETIRFIRPKLTLHEGYIRLATDFELSEQHMRQRVAEAFERIKNEH
ncbi:hypothetical protein niasHS_012257 [Heterodera schachtii]|uniref:Lipid-binding serum glycoprotein C-terminal domain-containing protein n=1 Tax=Heterodera schachtii TaxID=97005 RepID=A0ABD2IEL2_HETSC